MSFFAILFALLFFIYSRGAVGGGDVKLLTSLALGFPLMGVIELLAGTAVAGGVLAIVHLMMRQLPHPALAPAGSSVFRRVYAIERWRHRYPQSKRLRWRMQTTTASSISWWCNPTGQSFAFPTRMKGRVGT